MKETDDPLRTEARLRESERRLLAVLEQGPLAIAVTGPAGEIIFRNAEFDRLWGRPAHDTTAQTYSRVYEGYHLDGRPIASEEWPGARAVLQGETIQGEVLEIVHLSGRRIACSFNAGPIRDDEGRITGGVVMFRDVTEERRMQAALERQSEERYRAIVETARDYAIFTTDAEGLIETWPPGAEDVFGWPAVEAIGMSCNLTFTPEDRAAGVPEAELRSAREQGQSPNVRWHQRRDGSRVFIEGITRPLTDPDGRVTGYVKVGQDVTERRATDQRLRELNETLEQRVAEALAERQVLADFVEGANTSILAFDFNYRILAINKANADEIERAYGKRPRIGDNILDLLADMPEHQAHIGQTWGRALAGEEFTTVEEFGDAAHERVTYEVRFNVLRDREGNPIGAMQTAFDVSDRVRAQAELEHAQGRFVKAKRWRP
jgi:PAS domain S-box-containing protein